MKKAIVFGGSGFLGSHVADELTKKKYIVYIFDIKKSKFLSKKQKMIIGDINDLKKVKNAVRNMSYIFNFAGVSDIDEANINPLKTISSNIIGLTNIMESAKNEKKLKQIIFASSIYARSKHGGFYSTTKRACESILENYKKKYNIKYLILRFGSLYGERANHFNTINNFIHEALTKKTITRKSHGKEIRNYINVKDASEITINLLKKNCQNKYFNIYGKKKMSIKTIVKIIGKLTKIKKLYFKKNLIDDNHYNTSPYTFKIKKGFDITPKKKQNLINDLNKIILNFNKQ